MRQPSLILFPISSFDLDLDLHYRLIKDNLDIKHKLTKYFKKSCSFEFDFGFPSII